MVFFHESGKRHTFEGQLVTHLDRIISRVILLAKLPGNQRRSEVEKELRAHLDDLDEEARSQGYDDEAAARIVSMRFGEPEEVAAAFACVYAPERLAKLVLQLTILMAVSTMAVGVVIGIVQSIAAICSASSIISTLRDIHREVWGFGAIATGYCSLYAGERLFPTSTARALLPSVTLGLWLAVVFGWLAPQHVALPLAAFVCRIRSPAAARRNTLSLVCRNSAAVADSLGAVWCTDFRLAIPMVGVVRRDNFLQGVARNCSAL